MNLNLNGCVFHSVVVHELLHIAGFLHEHERFDRDNFVDVHWENIRENSFHNYYKSHAQGTSPSGSCSSQCTPTDTSRCGTCSNGRVTTSFGLAYDLDSIMHYDNRGFSKNGEDTLSYIFDSSRPLGSQVMTALDIRKLNAAYNCPALPCGGYFTDLDGIIDGTTCDMECQWFIKAPFAHVIVIEVLEFSFTSSPGDVTIEDFFAERTLATLGSIASPVGTTYLVKGTEARIILDRRSNDNTFVMKWTSIEAHDICCRTLNVQSPNSNFDSQHEGIYDYENFYYWTFGKFYDFLKYVQSDTDAF